MAVMKVFVVTQGEYSDYCIRAAFSTQEGAQRFIDAGGGESIENYECDEWTPDHGEWAFDFDLESGECTLEFYRANTSVPTADAYANTTHPGDPIRITVKHGNRERAIKVARERYTKIRAQWDEAVALVSAAPDRGHAWAQQRFILDVALVLAGEKQLPSEANASLYDMWLRAALRRPHAAE